MTNPERIELVQRAMEIIDTVIQDLDQTTKECECCGVVAKNNWNEFQIGQVLGSINKKAENMIRKMTEMENQCQQ